MPVLGTCGSFQHVVLEYARNVRGFEGAQHAEYDPYASGCSSPSSPAPSPERGRRSFFITILFVPQLRSIAASLHSLTTAYLRGPMQPVAVADQS